MTNFDISKIGGAVLSNVKMFGNKKLYGIVAIKFILTDREISVCVNENEDSLVWVDGRFLNKYINETEIHNNFWDPYLGKTILYVWAMKNQCNYEDCAQFMFAPQNSDFEIVQLMAMGSCIKVFNLTQGNIN